MTSGMGIVVRRAKELDGGAGGISCCSVRAPVSAENMLDKRGKAARGREAVEVSGGNLTRRTRVARFRHAAVFGRM